MGPKAVALTDGKRGAWVADEEKILHASALTQKAKDTTGAGDAFCSGYLAAYIKEKSLEECLRWGIANGASSVEFYGAIEGLLRESEIAEKLSPIQAEEVK